jgi:hypothetical protein
MDFGEGIGIPRKIFSCMSECVTLLNRAESALCRFPEIDTRPIQSWHWVWVTSILHHEASGGKARALQSSNSDQLPWRWSCLAEGRMSAVT